jgi:hypothetical protein
MAEPSKDYIERICPLFCDKYNNENGTNFIFDKMENSKCDIDFYIKDGDKVLPVQYSKIQSSPLYLKSKAQTSIVTKKLEEMGKILGFKCTVSITFKIVPIKESEIDNFVRCFMIFLRYHLSNNSFKLRFKASNDQDMLKGIFNYLSEFEVVSIGDSGFALLIGNEAWGYERTIDEDVDHHLKQILDKDAKYTPDNNLILLLDIDPIPIDGITLYELRKKCSSQKFNCREIWQINIGNSGFCDKLYPLTNKQTH